MANYSYTAALSGTKTTAITGTASTANVGINTATTPWNPSVSRGDVSLNAHIAGVPGDLVLSSSGSIGVSTESANSELTVAPPRPLFIRFEAFELFL